MNTLDCSLQSCSLIGKLQCALLLYSAYTTGSERSWYLDISSIANAEREGSSFD